MSWADNLNILLNTGKLFADNARANQDRALGYAQLAQQATDTGLQIKSKTADRWMQGISNFGENIGKGIESGRQRAYDWNKMEAEQAFEKPYKEAEKDLNIAKLAFEKDQALPDTIYGQTKAAVKGQTELPRELQEKDWTHPEATYDLKYVGKFTIPASFDEQSAIDRQKILDSYLDKENAYLENLLFNARGNAEKDNIDDLTNVMNLSKQSVLLKLFEKGYTDAEFTPTWNIPGTAAYNSVAPEDTSPLAMQWRYQKWYDDIKKNAPEVATEVEARDNLLKKTYPGSYAAYTETDKDAVKKYLFSPAQTPDDFLGGNYGAGLKEAEKAGASASIPTDAGFLQKAWANAQQNVINLAKGIGINMPKYQSYVDELTAAIQEKDKEKEEFGIEKSEKTTYKTIEGTLNLMDKYYGGDRKKFTPDATAEEGKLIALKGLLRDNTDYLKTLSSEEMNALNTILGYYGINWTHANYFEDNPEKKPSKATWNVFDSIISRYRPNRSGSPF